MIIDLRLRPVSASRGATTNPRVPLDQPRSIPAGRILVLIGSVVAILALVKPMFGYFLPDSVSFDFGNHLALVVGALDTWQETHAPPISSDALLPGIEYPYFLFGNAAFYLLASFFSFVLHVPAF